MLSDKWARIRAILIKQYGVDRKCELKCILVCADPVAFQNVAAFYNLVVWPTYRDIIFFI